MTAHFLLFGTSIDARVHIALCGRAISWREHSTTPTCVQCVAWLQADEAEAQALAHKWDAEDEAKRAGKAF